MALVVEDGTGLANADSYVSLTDAAAYATARGLTWTGTDAEKEVALRVATSFIDANYRGRFSGRRLRGYAQALEWPRSYAYTALDPPEAIASDAVPREVVAATVEVASRERANPGSMSPDVTTSQIIKKVSVEGAVSVEYADPGGAYDQGVVITSLDGILAPILVAAAGAPGLFGEAFRY